MGLAVITEQRFDDLRRRIRGLEPAFAQIRQARDFAFVNLQARQGRSNRDGYLALRASIENLKRLGEIARRAEASRPIKWIKRAVAQYGLTVADLGL